jgi:negative regulator of sigma E activity
LETLLVQARHLSEAADDELDEARHRMHLIGASLRREFSGIRTSINGKQRARRRVT